MHPESDVIRVVMVKAHFILLVLLSPFAQAQQGTPVTLSIAGDGVATAAGANYAITFSGTAMLTGFAPAMLYASGTANLISVATTGNVSGGFAILFANGDALTGQITVPAGYLVPALGQTANATGSITITGGAGNFAGANGSFPTVTGSGTSTGALSSHLTASGSGTLRLPLVHVPGTLAYAGSMAHLASGGGWKTTVILLNNGAAPAQAQVNFFDDNGNPLTLPLTFPQGATIASLSVPTLSMTTVNQTIPAGGELVIESQGPDNALTLGSAQLSTDGNIGGFIIFRYNPTGQEAAVPLQVQNAAAYTLSFDNTAGLGTGVAVANVSNQAANVQTTVRDDTGAVLATDTVKLAASGHFSFALSDRYPAAAQHRGTIQFQTPANGQISVLGIRAATSGAYTTIPAVTK
jgi:hypothetical protein